MLRHCCVRRGASNTITVHTDRRKVVRKFGLPDPKKSSPAFAANLVVVGCDETGTGCLAGPLVATAFCVAPGVTNFECEGVICDSKALTAAARQRLYDELMAREKGNCDANPTSSTASSSSSSSSSSFEVVSGGGGTCVSSTKIAPTDIIDGVANMTTTRLNYLSLAVRDVVARVRAKSPQSVFCVIVDGQEMPSDLPLDFPLCAAVPKADSKFMAVAAASVIAKVERDRIMREFDEKYPGWGFAEHKGYGTAEHVAQLGSSEHMSPIHRRTFASHLLGKKLP